MKVTKVLGVTELYNSLHKRPNYKEEEDAKKRKDDEEQYKELKEKMEDFQKQLEKFMEENESNPFSTEGDKMSQFEEELLLIKQRYHEAKLSGINHHLGAIRTTSIDWTRVGGEHPQKPTKGISLKDCEKYK